MRCSLQGSGGNLRIGREMLRRCVDCYRFAMLLLINRLILAILVAGTLATAADNRPRFEVASTKPCKVDMIPGGRGGGGPTETSSERMTLNCTTVQDLVKMAYVTFANGHFDQLSSVPIEGGPAWIHSEQYQIEAKTESTQSPITMRGVMLQTLLEDRFRLKIHRETREAPIYALRVAKGGLRMQRFKEGTCTPIDLVQYVSHFLPVDLPDLPPDQKYCPNNSAPLHGPNIVSDAQG